MLFVPSVSLALKAYRIRRLKYTLIKVVFSDSGMISIAVSHLDVRDKIKVHLADMFPLMTESR